MQLFNTGAIAASISNQQSHQQNTAQSAVGNQSRNYTVTKIQRLQL
jgi:hypothetical protein